MQRILPFRKLSEITDQEMIDIAHLSGEFLLDFKIESILREKNEDGIIQSIILTGKDTFSDGSRSTKQLCLNVWGSVHMINNPVSDQCNNSCARDVLCREFTVLCYLQRRGFDFSEFNEDADFVIRDKEGWLTQQQKSSMMDINDSY